MLLINPLFLTTNLLFVVATMSAAILYFIIRWAFIDRTGNLGINATKYWRRRKDEDGMSWTMVQDKTYLENIKPSTMIKY